VRNVRPLIGVLLGSGRADSEPGLNPNVFHAFVAGADGNFDDAHQMYEATVHAWNAQHAPVEEAPAPPRTIHEAVDHLVRDLRATR
jgi:hypothetical protein